jgi:glycosyltransferase involved in cell wall biosynthesis
MVAPGKEAAETAMRVLALTPSRPGSSPGQRSSIELWDKVLAREGIAVEYAPFETDRLAEVLPQRGYMLVKAREMLRAYWRRLRLVRHIGNFDAVFIYREAALIGPAFLERLVAASGKPLIYQLDDPLYVPYVSPTNSVLSYLKCFGKVATICRLSRVVIVNSSHHREYAERHAQDVRVIPSVVDGKVYTRADAGRRLEPHRVCVGWSGSTSSASNLRLVEEPLRRLRERTGCRLHFIGARGSDLPDIGGTCQPWRAETEVEDLGQLDIGLVPVLDTPWNRRKFYMKVVQYMALGIVPVATPLGSNPEVIAHGRNGFLADSAEDWLRFLETLATDAELRARMAQEAVRTAHSRYTLEANHAEIVGAFRSALAAQSARPNDPDSSCTPGGSGW